MLLRYHCYITITFTFMLSIFFAPLTLFASEFSEFAETSSTTATARLSLEEAIQMALRNNLELKVAAKDVELAQAGLWKVAFMSNPEFKAEFSNDEDELRSFELSKSFQLGQKKNKRKMAQFLYQKAQRDFEDKQRLVVKEVKSAFYELLLLQEKLKLADKAVELNQRLADIAQVKFEAGDIPITEVNLAKIGLQKAIRERAELESNLIVAQIKLNNLLGRSPDEKLMAKGELKTKPENPIEIERNLMKAKALALEKRPDLKSLELEAQADLSEISLARLERLPEFELSANLEREKGGETPVGVGAAISLPIFDLKKGGVKESIVQKSKADSEIANLKSIIEREVAEAFIKLQSAQRQLRLYRDGILDLLDKNLELVQTSYQLGEADILEVIITQNEFIESNFSYLDALGDYQLTLSDLEAAIGKTDEEMRR